MYFSSPNQPSSESAEGYWGISFVLAIIAHGILFCLLFVAIQWKSQPSGPIYAELWGGGGTPLTSTEEPVTEAATPEVAPEPAPEPESEPEPQVEPEPEPQPEPEPTPEPAPEPVPPVPETVLPPPDRTDLDQQSTPEKEPDIVQEQLEEELKKKEEEEKQKAIERERELEQARIAEEKRKLEEQRKEELRREEERKKEEQARIARERKEAEDKAKKEKEEAEKRKKQQEEKAEAAAAAQRRSAVLGRLSGQSGSAIGQGGFGGGGLTSAQRAQYENRIRACIRPYITYTPPATARRGQYIAIFEVSLARNGKQTVAPKQVQRSKLPAYDQAVERAIRRCDPFPKPPVGDAPPSITLRFDPIDDTQK